MYYIGHAVEPPPYPAELSRTAHDFLNLIFKRNPRKRANVCQLLRHPFITNADVIDLPREPSSSVVLMSEEEKSRIVHRVENIKNDEREDELASITSPKSIRPAIEADSGVDESEYMTNGPHNNVNAPFTFVPKQAGQFGKGPAAAVPNGPALEKLREMVRRNSLHTKAAGKDKDKDKAPDAGNGKMECKRVEVAKQA